jgi:hypothetical protein
LYGLNVVVFQNVLDVAALYTDEVFRVFKTVTDVLISFLNGVRQTECAVEILQAGLRVLHFLVRNVVGIIQVSRGKFN